MRAERTFDRSFASLAGIFEFIRDFFSREGIDLSHLHAVSFSIEEVFTNLVKYNAGTERIQLGLETAGGILTIRLTDSDVEPFDLTQVPEADVHLPADQRPVGKLGLHLVRRMVDDIEYTYKDRQSTITMTKRVGEHHVRD